MESCFALVRPPGHHATPRQSMGFVSLTTSRRARWAREVAGLQRVCIVDLTCIMVTVPTTYSTQTKASFMCRCTSIRSIPEPVTGAGQHMCEDRTTT